MGIHTTTDVSTDTNGKTWRQSSVFQSLEALRPWLQWGFLGVLAIGGTYLYQRDTNAQQSVDMTDIKRKQDVLQKTMDERWLNRNKEMLDMKNGVVSKELFEERTNYINKRLDQIDQRTMEILNRLPLRNP